MALGSILKAVKLWFDQYDAADEISGLVGGRLYYGEGPEEVAWPYVTWIETATTTLRVFGGLDLEQTDIRFSIFTATPDEARIIADALCDAFDEADNADVGGLMYIEADYQHINCLRISKGLIPDERYWQYAVTYRIIAQKV